MQIHFGKPQSSNTAPWGVNSCRWLGSMLNNWEVKWPQQFGWEEMREHHVGGRVERGRLTVQLWSALARSNLRGTLGCTVPTTQPQWPHKRVSVSPEHWSEQWPRSPSTSILTPSTQRGTMLPIGWRGIPKPPAVDTDVSRSLRPNVCWT